MIDDAGRQRGQPTRGEQLKTVGELTMSSQREGDVHSVCVVGELDLATVDSVEQELERVEATDAGLIVLDFSGLTFVDSTGIRLAVRAHARSHANGERLSLRRGPAGVQRAFELCGVDRVLPFAD